MELKKIFIIIFFVFIFSNLNADIIKPSKNFIFAFEITANHSYSDNLDGSYPGDKQKLSSDNFGSSLSSTKFCF